MDFTLSFLLFLQFISVVGGSNITATSSGAQNSTSNWGSCGTTACAGGAGNSASLTQTTGISSPSVSGSAMSLAFTSPASGNNALFYWKPGNCDTCTWIKFDTYAYVPTGVANYEFDNFIYDQTDNIDFMFGHQCNTSTGFWQYANQTSSWTNSSISCSLSTGTWHHLIFYDYYLKGDTSCTGGLPCEHFGTLTIDGTQSSWGTNIASTTLTMGWTRTYGCQFQMDSSTNATLTEYIDNVNCQVGK